MLETTKLAQFELDFKLIGDDISKWRNQSSLREILEPKEFKTVADKKAHDLICKLIASTFGDVTILSEEEDIKEGTRPEKYWLIDPIDGTASWYDGYDGFVTQAAYIENNISIYGIVYAPVMNKLWTAVKDQGAFFNGKRLSLFKDNKRLNLIDNYPEPRRIAKTIVENMPVDKYIECGSLGLKSCMIAAGIADLFVKDVVIRDWDIAPVLRIIEELEGFVTDLNGNKIELKGSFVKENGLVVSRSAKLVSDIVSLKGK